MRARELRAQGRDIIALTIGQPDFNTPEHVKQGVMEALARNETNTRQSTASRSCAKRLRVNFSARTGSNTAPIR